MMKIYYHVEVDCANCAREVEEALNGMEELEHVSIDFIEKKMTVEIPDSSFDNYEAIEREIIRVSTETEPDFRMWPMTDDDEEEEEEGFPWEILIGCIFIAFGLLYEYVFDFRIDDVLMKAIFFVGLILTGHEVLENTFRNILNRNFMDENFLMTVAAVSAICIGYCTESIAVLVFFMIGEFFEDRAVGRSRTSVKALVGLKVPFSTVIRDGEKVEVRTESVGVGETVVIRPGDMVPIDGKVASGSCHMDTKTMTGEAIPRFVKEGDNVLSGFVNTDSAITIVTTCPYKESAAAKVLSLIEDSQTKKSTSERFMTKFARYYTPVVIALAITIAVIPTIIMPDRWTEWVYKGILMLVVSCPCALVVSIPLSYYCGIGNASRNGILVKGSCHIEVLSKAGTVVFDKTGTLTVGEFSVRGMESVGMSEDEMLRYAASAESYSTHPIARSICNYAGVTDSEVSEGEYIPGMGVSATVDGKKVLAGNLQLMRSIGITDASDDPRGTTVHVSVDGSYAGYIVISDSVKPDSKEAVGKLKGLGVRTCMLTGDRSDVAERVASELDLDQFEAELLPADKTERLKGIMDGSKGTTVFVGDGINDAPSLALADVGIAMGNLGSDAAIEASDMVIVNDCPSKIAEGISISKKTQRIVWQNIILALGTKFSILALTAFTDVINMWVAVFGDVGVLILVIFNSIRALGVRKIECEDDVCSAE